MEEEIMQGVGYYDIFGKRPLKENVFKAFGDEKPLILILEKFESKPNMYFRVELIIDMLCLYRRKTQKELKGYWEIDGHIIRCDRLNDHEQIIYSEDLSQKYVKFEGGAIEKLEGVYIEIFQKREKRMKNK